MFVLEFKLFIPPELWCFVAVHSILVFLCSSCIRVFVVLKFDILDNGLAEVECTTLTTFALCSILFVCNWFFKLSYSLSILVRSLPALLQSRMFFHSSAERHVLQYPSGYVFVVPL